MPLNQVTVTGTIPGANVATSVEFTASNWLQDAGDSQTIPPAPVLVYCNGSGHFSVALVATDNSVTPAGWYWTITISGVPNVATVTWSFFLKYSSGATQDLSTLVAVSPPAQVTGFLPLPAGTATAGYVPVASGTGEGSTWGPNGTGGSGYPASPVVSGTPSAGQVLTATSPTAADWQTPASGGGVASVAAADTSIVIGGTATNPTVRTGTLDVIATDHPPAAAVPMNGQKLTGLANGSAATDSVAYGQLGTAAFQATGAFDASGAAATAQTNAEAFTTAGFAPLKPWQFTPESYGAKGDGKLIGDLVLNGTTTATSASAGFTSSDTGKHIMVNGGLGTAAGPLITTITFVNATTITLGTAAAVSGSGFAAIYGTDDTAAVNSAVSAANTYAVAHQYFAEVVFKALFYILASGPTQTTTPAVQNAQIPLPYPNVNGTTQKLVIALTGASENSQAQFWESTVPNLQGTCLVSFLQPSNTVNPTYGRQSVVGGPSGGGAFTGGFANMKPVVTNISVWCPAFTNSVALDFSFCGGVGLDGCSVNVFAPANAGQHPYMSDMPPLAFFQGTIGRGLIMPLDTNNDDCYVPTFTAEGYEVCVAAQDHATFGRLVTVYTDLAFLIDLTDGASGTSHLLSIQSWSCEAYNGALKSNGGGGSYCWVDINLDSEANAGGANPSYDISDSANTLYGVVRWSDILRTVPAPILVGGANLAVLNARTGSLALGGALTPKVVALTFAASIAVNAALANSFNLTLTASTGTLANPTNPVDGQVIRFRVTQGTGGSFTLAYGTAYDFGAAGAPTLSTAAGKVDVLGFEYVASLSKWVYLGAALGN